MNQDLKDFITLNLSPNEILQIKWVMDIIHKKHPQNTFTLTDLHKVLNTK